MSLISPSVNLPRFLLFLGVFFFFLIYELLLNDLKVEVKYTDEINLALWT